MKFLRFYFTILFAYVLTALSNAQQTVIPQTTIVDSTAKDTLLFIASVNIYGNKKTKSFIIERELPFKQGDYISKEQLQKDLITAKNQLVNMSLFLNVSVYIENQYGQYVFVTVYVQERWYIFPLPYVRYIDPNFNTWWVTNNHSLKRLNYGVKFLHSNITGRNDKFTAWLITGYSQQVAIKYERPFIDKKLKNGLSGYFNYSYQRELNYKTFDSKEQFFRPDSLFFLRRGIKAELDYTYRPGLRVRHIFRAGYMYEKVADTILALNPNYFSNGKMKQSFPFVGYTLWYSNADYNAYPTKGLISQTTILHRGINADMNLTQLQLVNTYTIPLLPKTQLQLKEGAVLSLPFNQPYYNKNLFGYGGIFMRGYEYYVLDGVAGAIGRATIQHQLFNFSTVVGAGTKRQTDFPFKFYGKLYTDVGYAYDKHAENNMLSNKLLHSWGLGIDVITAYDFVLKIDYSFNQLSENSFFLHMAVDF